MKRLMELLQQHCRLFATFEHGQYHLRLQDLHHPTIAFTASHADFHLAAANVAKQFDQWLSVVQQQSTC